MTAKKDWADFLLRLELERHRPTPEAVPEPFLPVTPEQAAENAQALLDALDGVPVMADFESRRSA